MVSTFDTVCVNFKLKLNHSLRCMSHAELLILHIQILSSAKPVIPNFQVTVCNVFISLIHYCSHLYVNLISVNLYELKTYHEVIDEIYYKVTHLEPWEKGSRKTAGQTGMCGGVSGIITHL